jgi:hypothetical protein
LSFFQASECVHSMFHSSSQLVLMMFPNFAMFFPTCVPLHLTFIPICLEKMVSSFHLYRWAKGEELCTWKWSLLLLGVFIVSVLLSGEPIKIHSLQKNKLGRTSSN